MISKNPLGDIAKLNRICASAQIGWWEVNFTTGKCFISETLLKSLEVSSEWLDIDELMLFASRFKSQSPIRGSIACLNIGFETRAATSQSPYKGFNRTR